MCGREGWWLCGWLGGAAGAEEGGVRAAGEKERGREGAVEGWSLLAVCEEGENGFPPLDESFEEKYKCCQRRSRSASEAEYWWVCCAVVILQISHVSS